jgi:sugar phosphate isomerase/epimerase
MYLSLNRTLTAGEQPDWTSFVDLAAGAGYGGVDLDLAPAMLEGAEATRRKLAAAGLAVGGVNLPVDFRKDEATFEEELAGLDEAARFASEVGATAMCRWLPASTSSPKDELWQLYRERLARCDEVLVKHGLQLGLEFLGPLHLRQAEAYEFVWRFDEALEFARSIGETAGVLLDSWHWQLAGGTLQEIRDAGPAIVHVQVADVPDLPAEQIRDNERLLPGEGIIDFRGFFASLEAAGYVGAVSPEIFGRGMNKLAPAEGAKLGLEATAPLGNFERPAAKA